MPLFYWHTSAVVAAALYPIGASRHFPYKGKLSNASLSAYAGIKLDIGAPFTHPGRTLFAGDPSRGAVASGD